MSRPESVFQLLVESNPIPDIESLDFVVAAAPDYLATLEQRSSGMTNLDTRPKASPESRKTAWLVGVAVMIVIGVGVLAGTRLFGEPDTVAGGDPTAEQLAEAFVGGLAALDSEAVDGLVSPEATAMYLSIFGYGDAQPGSIQGLWEWGATYNQTYTFDEGCRETDNLGGPPRPAEQRTFYTCDYHLENDWTRALDQPPMSGRFRMEILEGRIVWLTEDFPFADLEEAWGAVIEWVQTEHPEDFTTMFLDGPPGAGLAESAKLTEASIALWKEYNSQIVQSLGG